MSDEKDSWANGLWVGVLFVLLVWFFFFGRRDTYRPIYYPDRNNLTEYIKGPKFSSIEDAREWVYEKNEQRRDQNWDYEIGKDPKLSKYADIEICEETLQ
jgi:hypothetical protein